MNKRMLSLLVAILLGLSVTACGQSQVSDAGAQTEMTEDTQETIDIEESGSVAGKSGMDAALLGVWSFYDTVSDEYSQFDFMDDGTMTIRVNDFEAEASYEINDGQLHLAFISGDAFDAQDMTYEVVDDTLVLKRDQDNALTLTKGAFEVVKSSTAQTKASETSETKAEVKAVTYKPVRGDLVELMNNDTLSLNAVSIESMPSEDGETLDTLAVRLLMKNTSEQNISVIIVEQGLNGVASGEQVYSGYASLVPGTTYKTTLASEFSSLTEKIAFPIAGSETYAIAVIVLPEGADVDAAVQSYFESGQAADAISVTPVNINLSSFTIS